MHYCLHPFQLLSKFHIFPSLGRDLCLLSHSTFGQSYSSLVKYFHIFHIQRDASCLDVTRKPTMCHPRYLHLFVHLHCHTFMVFEVFPYLYRRHTLTSKCLNSKVKQHLSHHNSPRLDIISTRTTYLPTPKLKLDRTTSIASIQEQVSFQHPSYFHFVYHQVRTYSMFVTTMLISQTPGSTNGTLHHSEYQ